MKINLIQTLDNMIARFLELVEQLSSAFKVISVKYSRLKTL
jgi:hypothetical protein